MWMNAEDEVCQGWRGNMEYSVITASVVAPRSLMQSFIEISTPQCDHKGLLCLQHLCKDLRILLENKGHFDLEQPVLQSLKGGLQWSDTTASYKQTIANEKIAQLDMPNSMD
ncbi:hypothetical protein EK904_001224 [Melospiza melodia maxima]|nr:hypothetical protein EK904_001224 [Melospiza melodia maxima]